MNCGLLDRNGQCLKLPCDSDAQVTTDISARLPADACGAPRRTSTTPLPVFGVSRLSSGSPMAV